MKISISRKILLLIAGCIALSFAAGFLNGLVGTGAGILFLLLSRLTMGEISKDTFAFSMACVIPLSAFSLFTYPLPDTFSLSTLLVTFTTAALGGIAGAIFQSRVKLSLLKKLFALLVIYSGINMLLR